MKNPQSPDWDYFWSKEAKAGRRASWSKRRILKVVEPFLEGRHKILDAGSGSGFFSKYFCGRGLTTVALDYSDEALFLTEQLTQGRARTIKADLLSENLAGIFKGKFDVIFSDGLFEHFDSGGQDQILKNFLSILAPGGLIITFVPNRFSPWEMIRPFFMPGIEEVPFVLSHLVRLHERHGLTLKKKGGINTLPFLFSPDALLGPYFGMLLYAIAEKR